MLKNSSGFSLLLFHAGNCVTHQTLLSVIGLYDALRREHRRNDSVQSHLVRIGYQTYDYNFVGCCFVLYITQPKVQAVLSCTAMLGISFAFHCRYR